MSLKKRVAILFLALYVILGGICLYLYNYYYKMLRNTTMESMELIVGNCTSQVQNLIASINNAINVINDNEQSYILANRSNISDTLQWIINTDPTAQGADLYQITEEFAGKRKQLDALFTMAPGGVDKEFFHTFIVLEQYPISKIMTNWRGLNSEPYINSKNMDQEWYIHAMEAQGEMYWFSLEEHPNRVFCAKLLTYQESKEISEYHLRKIGTLVLGFDTSWICEQYGEENYMEGVGVFLANEEGNVFWQDGITDVEIATEIPLIDEEENTWKYRGEVYYVKKQNVGENLIMTTLVPLQRLERNIFEAIKVVLILLVSILGFYGITVFLIRKMLLKPIEKIAKEMESGVLQQIDTQIVSKNEIIILYSSYNQMQIRIQELLRDVRNAAIKQKETEIRELQLQINPHFIFNTLSNISSSALLSGQEKIADAISALASVLRYNTRNFNKTVPLIHEIQMLKMYEAIQKMSYGDRVSFCYRIDKACEEILIPKLIIQPLVENAIAHGMDPVRKQEIIRVHAEVAAEHLLIIKVINYGNKINVEEVNRYIMGKGQLQQSTESFGLQNVFRRLTAIHEYNKLYYTINDDGDTEAVIHFRFYG